MLCRVAAGVCVVGVGIWKLLKTDGFLKQTISRSSSLAGGGAGGNDTKGTPDHYDIVIGLPSYNEADTIRHVVQAVDAGIAKYAPGLRCLIVNSDCLSSDDTAVVFSGTATVNAKEYHTTPVARAGKGAAMKHIFNRVSQTQARYCIVVDTDLYTISPEWVRSFLLALLQGYDFVTPRYARHRYDGTITNHVIYPLMYGLLGQNIRQPIGGDFAFSRRACQACLDATWSPTTYKYGIDIFMTVTAMRNKLSLAEVELSPKIHKPSAPKLHEMVEQVVGTFIQLLTICNEQVHNIDTVTQIHKICTDATDGMKIPSLKVDVPSMVTNAQDYFDANCDVLRRVLTPDVLAMISSGKISQGLGREQWCGLLYSISAQFVKTNNQECLLGIKLGYFLRTIASCKEVEGLSNDRAEQMVQEQAEYFFQNRNDYLKLLSAA